jgi:hypothetical protein
MLPDLRMRRFSQDTLKLGTTAALLGGASLLGWIGLGTVLASGRQAPADILVMSFGNLILTAIAGLLAWVLVEQPPAPQTVET